MESALTVDLKRHTYMMYMGAHTVWEHPILVQGVALPKPNAGTHCANTWRRESAKLIVECASVLMVWLRKYIVRSYRTSFPIEV